MDAGSRSDGDDWCLSESFFSAARIRTGCDCCVERLIEQDDLMVSARIDDSEKWNESARENGDESDFSSLNESGSFCHPPSLFDHRHRCGDRDGVVDAEEESETENVLTRVLSHSSFCLSFYLSFCSI